MKTFGTIQHAANTWLLQVEPHVAVKLKRVFPRVKQGAAGTIPLSDTIETCRELAWFIERYPLTGDPTALERLAARAAEHKERESLVSQMLAGIRDARPFDLAIPPRSYQRMAADMCLTAGGLLLADDVGLGKTCTGICVISDPRARPALVVTLTHLPKQWEAEVKRFAPQLRTHVIRSGPLYDLCNPPGRRAKKGQELLIRELPDVIITSYSKLSKWAEHLAPLVRGVVFDEAQELRRAESDKARSAKHLADSAVVRIALTATPIYNYGNEIFNVIDVVRPGELGTLEEFSTEWCSYERIRDPRAFGTYIRDAGLMLRRTRSDVGRELPELSRVPHHVDCDAAALASVETAATALAQVIVDSAGRARGEAMRAAEELSMLVRQATGVAKAPYVAEFVRILVESGEKVLLYGWHRDVYGIWNERLSDLKPAMYTGTESAAQKEEARRRFVEGETSVLIMSLRAGAGIDGLQHHCRTVVFGELDWSPGVHEQCCGRLHRDGQAEPVVAYFLIADSGSDPIVADVLGVKGDQADGIRDPNADLVQSLSVDPERIKRLAESYLLKRKAAA